MHFSPCKFRDWLIARRVSNRPTTQNHSLINYQHAFLYRTYVFSTQTQSQIICLFRRPVRRILSLHDMSSNKRSSENIVDGNCNDTALPTPLCTTRTRRTLPPCLIFILILYIKWNTIKTDKACRKDSDKPHTSLNFSDDLIFANPASFAAIRVRWRL